MSILRIVCDPADIGVGGYVFDTEDFRLFDNTRVRGAFKFDGSSALPVPHGTPSGDEVWYHFRHSQRRSDYSLSNHAFLIIRDENSNELARLKFDDSRVGVQAVGDTTVSSGYQSLAAFTPYSFDVHVTVAATITARLYINGALYGEVVAANTAAKGVARSITWQGEETNYNASHFSELVIADEDTRGMRIREMRPKSFGIFQEWDGSISALRDNDLATGISTDTALRRVSFGITNIENVQPGDVINRVVSQTFAQRGETGLSGFNHFFRHKNGNVSDGATQTLSVLGEYFLEEFPLNPDTSAAWQAADFGSLQTGIQSLA